MKKTTVLAICLGIFFVWVASGCGSPISRNAPPTFVAATTPTIISTQSPFLCQNNSPEVYLVANNERRHITDEETFLNLGFKPDQIRACGASANLPEGKPLTRLLKASGEGVYRMENGLRRYIPDMSTFRALGYREQDIAVVPDDLLATWDVGQPMRVGQDTSLRAALQNIHDQSKIDPSRGCFELFTPYPEYHKRLQKISALLLNDPRAQSLSVAERQAMFANVTGFDGVRFIAGTPGSTLVSLKTNRGYKLGCGSHYESPDALHVVDAQSNIYDLGAMGLVKQTRWISDRWIVLSQLKLDTTSGPTPWKMWHVAQASGKWQHVVDFEFTPTPYNFGAPPPIRFENGYQTMSADLDYWWADDPCDFNAAFKNAYKHDTWQMRRTYRLTNDSYTQVSSEVLKFQVQRKDTGEQVTVDWKSFCVGGVR